MPLETLDQTAHKGKCHWKPVTVTDAPALQAHFAELLTLDRKALEEDAIMQSRGLGCLH